MSLNAPNHFQYADGSPTSVSDHDFRSAPTQNARPVPVTTTTRTSSSHDASSQARATIRLNRPEVLNAFDFRMLREIARACEDASWDDDIRVVVVTGTGRAFCVGADLKSWGETLVGDQSAYWKWFGAFKDMHDRLREIGKPTLARIQGIAVGGGNELQMACDLAVMVDHAFIRHVGLEHGSVPAGGATQWLPIMVGDRRAREIIMMCENVPAAKAAEWGLVNWVVPEAELDTKVDEVVEKLARKLPASTRYAKQHLNLSLIHI